MSMTEQCPIALYLIPAPVKALMKKGGLLTGSQAKRLATGLTPKPDSDWDVVMPAEEYLALEAIFGPKPRKSDPDKYGWGPHTCYETQSVKIDAFAEQLDVFLHRATVSRGETFVIDLRGFVTHHRPAPVMSVPPPCPETAF